MTNEIAVFENSILDGFNNKNRFFTSIDLNSEGARDKLYKATTVCDKKISDCINMSITIKDFYLDTIQLIDKESGEFRDIPRLVLFDNEGISYYSVSSGFYRSFENFVRFYGTPDKWVNPVTIKIKQVETRAGNRTFSFDLV